MPPTELSETMRFVGIDPAWGERNGDGLCLLEAMPGGATRFVESAHVFGDEALLGWLEERLPPAPGPAMLLFDAPLICPNVTGSRPADRQTHTRFGRFHAGAHPANRTLCPRPLRLAEAVVRRLGFEVGWQRPRESRLAVEVFPHPAAVRWLRLERIVKYKRPPMASRRSEFARMQRLLAGCLDERFAEVRGRQVVEEVLTAPWTKPTEDRLDALICALVGYHHWKHDGTRSEVLGDTETGFIVVPGKMTNDE